ncbi:MAG: aminotransferase class I/II-fold pyridoxal phosphate-dependent enzyme [Bacteroidales bacterium]|nr:aminotransferase class I/II-fold pyridoxal phosphate-dependent enzyme [Bacteroidales bacterium]
MTTGPTTIAMMAAIEALEGDQTFIGLMVATYRRRRDLLLNKLKGLPLLKNNVPQGAFYVFPDCSAYFGKSCNNITIRSAEDLCVYLLEEAHVGTVPGEAFGEPNCFRISYATSDDKLTEGMDRIKKALDKLV